MVKSGLEQCTYTYYYILFFLASRNMKPPGSTKAAVYQWNNALGHVTDQLGMFKFYYGMV